MIKQKFLYSYIFICCIGAIFPSVACEQTTPFGKKKRAGDSLSSVAPPAQIRRIDDAAASAEQLSLGSDEGAIRIGNPCIDGIFQYGFASPLALTGFLNAVLNFEGEQAIETIEYIKRDMPASDPTAATGYNFTVDVRCRTKHNHHFLIEMQNDFRGDYHAKALIEHARMLSRLDIEQSPGAEEQRTAINADDKNKFWKGIQGVYTIVLTNKSFSKKKTHYPEEQLMEPELVNAYEMRHVQHAERRYGDMHNRIILLMLSNLRQAPASALSPIEKWSYIFKDSKLSTGVKKIEPEKTIEYLSDISSGNPAIKEFIDRINMATLPDEIRERYLNNIKYYNDSIVDITEKAEARGMEKGIEQGKAEGIAEGRMRTILEAVKILRDDNESDENVKQHLSRFYKDLSAEKINELCALSTDEIKTKLQTLEGTVIVVEAAAAAAGSAGS